MPEPPELEISVGYGEGKFRADLRFTNFEKDDVQALEGIEIPLDLPALRLLDLDPVAYGKELGAILAVDAVAKMLAVALEAAGKQPLRIRFTMQPTAAALHAVRWELIRDDAGPLFTRGTMVCSRFLTSMRSLPGRPSEGLTALVAIASPGNLSNYKLHGRPLPPIDACVERAFVEASIGPHTKLTFLDGPCTMRNLMVALRDGVDVLHLVCHGALIAPAGGVSLHGDPEPHLWLEDEAGQTAIMDGRTFVSRLSDLLHPPRLIVLASCQSAGAGASPTLRSTGALSALGPRLVQSGIPAVVAMQGDVEVKTIEEFLPLFVERLGRHGAVDLAMAEARSAIRERSDWWVPVLFMRLRTGRIWYKAGFATESQDWGAVVGAIRNGDCTPILGPDLSESLIGTQRDLAASIARANRFPLAQFLSDDLSHVMQFLTDLKGPRVAERTLLIAKVAAILDRFRGRIDPAIARNSPAVMDLERLREHYRELLVAAWKIQAAANEDPYTHLAAMRSRTYISADSSPLLELALREAGRQPEVVHCPWTDDLSRRRNVFESERNFKPAVERPLLYYVRGSDDDAESLVITEDDYFAFMLGVGERRTNIPPCVTRALTDAEVLFLGFGLDDWAFRALFRSLMTQEGEILRTNYRHVAVQVDLEEGRFQDPVVARKYLEKSFGRAQIDIYWGRVQQFMSELTRHLQGGDR